MDIFFFIVLMAIPLGWILVIKQDYLHQQSVFLKYLLASIVLVILGVVYQEYAETEKKFLVYIGSQMTFIFLILYKLLSIPFHAIFKRRPEINAYEANNLADWIVTMIIIIGIIALPLIIDNYYFQKFKE